MAEQIRVYRVSQSEITPAGALDLAVRLFATDRFSLSKTQGAFSLRNGSRIIEVARATGGVWAADQAQLWRSSIKARLPKPSNAVNVASKFLDERNLLPESNDSLQLGKPIVGGTFFSFKRVGGHPERRQLDVQVTFPMRLNGIDVVGGGSDITVTIGHRAEVIGYSSAWRRPESAFAAELLPRDLVDRQFVELMSAMNVEWFDARLAYYAGPSFELQQFIYPVYVYRARGRIGDQVVPLRQVLIPATAFGPGLGGVLGFVMHHRAVRGARWRHRPGEVPLDSWRRSSQSAWPGHGTA